jgi:protein O-GlcNAc transferase
MTSLEAESVRQIANGTGKPTLGMTAMQMNDLMHKAQLLYNSGAYTDALSCCEKVYESDAYRTENLLLLGAIHFQLRNFSESIFYNQQCIRVDANFAEAYSNLGNALKELGDLKGATKFYLKVRTSSEVLPVTSHPIC